MSGQFKLTGRNRLVKEIYIWVPYFNELTHKIAEGGEKHLIEAAKRVAWKKEGSISPLLNFGDEGIDPFSFIYTVAGYSKWKESRKRIYGSLSSIFEMESELPADLDEAFFFPTPTVQNTLFHSGRRSQEDTDLLWRLFRSAVSGFDEIDPKTFSGALAIPRVATTKLTQALFLVNSDAFIPIDHHTASLGLFGFYRIPKRITLDEYAGLLDRLKVAFPGCCLFEINLVAYLKLTLGMFPKNYFQISTNAYEDGVDRWPDFRDNNHVYTGGPGKDNPYPLDQPKEGDVVLVRYGREEGRGVGVVYRNDYRDGGWTEDRKLHVLWLNKLNESLANFTTMRGFSEAGHQTQNAFRNTDAYAPTFGHLERFVPDDTEELQESTAVEHPRNRILYGPPGTGKTWHAVNHALAIIDGTEVHAKIERERFDELRFNPDDGTGQITMVTFHQNFAYEDFIEGIRPNLEGNNITYQLRDGVFKRIANAAESVPEHRFVLIIDEINRGNIAKIFGELITLIEDSRRIGRDDQTFVTLPYSGELFAVPENLFLIGTMNTADRSIQLLDTALRRRFTFMEMMPEPRYEEIARDIDGVDCTRILETMNERISVLLDREHQIGHTYFLGIVSLNRLADTFRSRIFPLLQEYFFDDWAKIRAVLGDNAFVSVRNVENTRVLTEFVDEDGKLYERLPDNDDAWLDPAQYCRIYERKDADDLEDA